MRIAAIFTKKTSSDQTIAFHHPVFHVGKVSVAYPSPILRQIYDGLKTFEQTEVFVFHSPEDYSLIRHYLPELPVDNLVGLPSYDLQTQVTKLLDLCEEFDQPFCPFLIVPLDHIALNSADYFRALKASLTVAEQFGKPSILGNIGRFPVPHKNYIHSDQVFMSASTLDVANVAKYTPYSQVPDSEIEADDKIQDCGVVSWRANMAKKHVDTTNTTQSKETELNSLLGFEHLQDLHVVRGQYGLLDIHEEIVELVPYGSPDKNGNIHIGNIKPPDWSIEDIIDISNVVGLEDDEVRLSADASTLIAAANDLSLNDIEDELRRLEERGGFEHLISMIKALLK